MGHLIAFAVPAVELESGEVEKCEPNIDEMLRRGRGSIAVTSTSPEAGVDFVSRYFGPAVGIKEDPVTGFAHCRLVPYWAERLGKSTFFARQLSQRGGSLQLELQGDRVIMKGNAVTVLEGTLQV